MTGSQWCMRQTKPEKFRPPPTERRLRCATMKRVAAAIVPALDQALVAIVKPKVSAVLLEQESQHLSV